MTEKILFVDDEENILQSIKRELRKRFEIHTAEGGALALEILKRDGPFAIIVSDMRMPVMDGIQLLSTVKDIYPDTVRLMLTGNADQGTAIEAVNKGQIFRFLNKPCPTPTLVMALALALRQYRLITAEKELLDKTLKGSITVLSELLSMTNPMAFSSGLRIKNLVIHLAEQLQLHNLWQFEIAALMSQIGCVTLPSDVLNKFHAGKVLDPEEEVMYRNHPLVGSRLLEKIPRLEKVAAIIAHQLRPYSAFQEDLDLDEDISIGSQILKLAIDFDLLLHRDGNRRIEALQLLQEERDLYNPELLKILSGLKLEAEHEKVISVPVRGISVGMITEQNIIASNGVLIIPKGQEVTWALLQGLKNFSQQVEIKEPILVRVKKE
ncbi:MAG: response regulator [Proteobacteria bacterium]|nr:response regulator [Pseudomonadota bacterium]